MVQISRSCRETLHGAWTAEETAGAIQKRQNPDHFSHSGPQGAEGGHREEVGLGLAELRLIAFFI